MNKKELFDQMSQEQFVPSISSKAETWEQEIQGKLREVETAIDLLQQEYGSYLSVGITSEKKERAELVNLDLVLATAQHLAKKQDVNALNSILVWINQIRFTMAPAEALFELINRKGIQR
jgi:hypothetical protein